MVVMKTLQFEAIKLAIKQDKEGYVLTLRMHPDEIPEELLRDFVGARYQCVMVRLNAVDKPLIREQEYAGDQYVSKAGALCRNPAFWQYLIDDLQIMNALEDEAAEWLRNYLGIQSRAELKTNEQARNRLNTIYEEFLKWNHAS
jgi:hypothetical protein